MVCSGSGSFNPHDDRLGTAQYWTMLDPRACQAPAPESSFASKAYRTLPFSWRHISICEILGRNSRGKEKKRRRRGKSADEEEHSSAFTDNLAGIKSLSAVEPSKTVARHHQLESWKPKACTSPPRDTTWDEPRLGITIFLYPRLSKPTLLLFIDPRTQRTLKHPARSCSSMTRPTIAPYGIEGEQTHPSSITKGALCVTVQGTSNRHAPHLIVQPSSARNTPSVVVHGTAWPFP
ncbi:hypothetical protein VTI74DRAFT_10517 [Chaetomium olivicolor]